MWVIRVNAYSLVSGDHSTLRALLWILRYKCTDIPPKNLVCIETNNKSTHGPGCMLCMANRISGRENQVSVFWKLQGDSAYGAMWERTPLLCYSRVSSLDHPHSMWQFLRNAATRGQAGSAKWKASFLTRTPGDLCVPGRLRSNRRDDLRGSFYQILCQVF